MSDFFYKEKLGPIFSPVINVRHDNISPTVVSALDNLLSPSGNMFTRAETVRNLMKIENFSLEQASKALSLKRIDVANKLRLLEFSEKERAAVLEYGFSEVSALQFLSLDKLSRLYAMEYCKMRSFNEDEIGDYVKNTVETKKKQQAAVNRAAENVRKFVVNDIGFFFNSIENALRLARNAGFEVENERQENDDCYDIHIKVRKQNKRQ